jgi:DNA polymerase III sliding clamp (beta) subunit (PCNA family)
MGFNSKLFAETLSNIDGDTILISASLPNRAILIYPSSKLYTGLLMPVMLNDHTN